MTQARGRSRERKVGLDIDDLNRRHYEVVASFERGELPLEAYLDSVIFHKARAFGRPAFVGFMRSRSRPHR